MLDTFRAHFARTGTPPKPLTTKPELPAHLRWVRDAFSSISADRGGEGFGPVLFSAIDAYARRAGIDEPEEFARFERLIRALDAVWIADFQKRREYEDAAAESRAKLKG